MTTNAPTRPYDDAYLQAYSEEHVAYEFDMFLWSARLCASGAQLQAPSPSDTIRLSNVLLEGFVIHLRNVIDFFFLEKPKATDVVAADFCASGVWQPEISGTLDAARVRANKEIAHLSTARIAGAPVSKGWDFAALAAELHPVMRLFVAKALPARLSPKVATVTG